MTFSCFNKRCHVTEQGGGLGGRFPGSGCDPKKMSDPDQNLEMKTKADPDPIIEKKMIPDPTFHTYFCILIFDLILYHFIITLILWKGSGSGLWTKTGYGSAADLVRSRMSNSTDLIILIGHETTQKQIFGY